MLNPSGTAEVGEPTVTGSGGATDVGRGTVTGEGHAYSSEPAESIHHLNGSRCIVSSVHLSHPDLVLAGAIRETSTVRVSPNYQTTSNGATLLIFEVETETPETFDRALERDHTVADTMVVDYAGGSMVYRTRLTDEVLPITPLLGQLGVRIDECVGTGLGWSFRAQFPSRGAYSTFRRYCESNGVAFHVNTLSWGADEGAGTDQTLTPAQWQTLHTAYDRGYFDVPRRVSQAELAEDLQISSSAVSQRIRRIISQLLEESIESRER